MKYSSQCKNSVSPHILFSRCFYPHTCEDSSIFLSTTFVFFVQILFTLFSEAFFDSQNTFCCRFHFSSTSEILFTSAVVPLRVPYFIRFVLISFVHAAACSKPICSIYSFWWFILCFMWSHNMTVGFFCHNNFSDLVPSYPLYSLYLPLHLIQS